ncbi:CPBP family intramembrane glutamic endopeptidase [Paludisphaera sp.]|uniref:CPBP family intramembrane glutamic endopeptidase n=1 Tax=Paludisphaera sp. TaxID=2017432 RepID=UPI00301DFFB3
MTSPQVQSSFLLVVSMLLQMIIFGMVAAWLWAGARLLGGRGLPRVEPFAPPRPATWGPGTLLALFVAYFAAQMAASTVYQAVVGVDLAEVSSRYLAENDGPVVDPAEGGEGQDRDRRSAGDATHLMGWNATSSLLYLAAFPWIFRRVSGARLADLGFVRERLGEQARVGIVAALLVSPAVYAIHALAARAFPRQAHPVEQMLTTEFSLSTAAISLLGAVVLAPIVEELAFRGVLQGWLVRVSRGLSGRDRTDESAAESGPRGAMPGVVLASALFAAIHSPQWPAPIALFLLALVMGLVKEKTGSLTAAIVIHALFNATSTLGMLFAQLGGGRDPAVPPPAGWLSWLAAMFI